MHPSNLFLAFVTMLLAACSAPPVHDFAIVGVRLFDGVEVHEHMTVVVEDGRIAVISENFELPRGLPTVDGSGSTLLPGLIDSHTHAFKTALEDALRFGVTTELDMFTDHRWAAERRREQLAGGVTDRADLFSAGTLVTAPGGHGTEYPIEVPTLGQADMAEEFVTARLAEGSDYIKIVYDDGAVYGLSYATLGLQTLRAVTRATHLNDKLAVVHVATKSAALEAITSGADGLMHIFADEMIDDKLIQAAIRHATFVVPTLSVVESIDGGNGGAILRDDPSIDHLLSPEQRRNLGARFTIDAQHEDRLRIANDAVVRLHRAGIPILAGTDAPNPGTAHGASLHRELELLVEAGLSPLDALRAATSRPADAFRLHGRGRIAVGHQADLVLVDGDPTTDISSSRKIVTIWKQGIEVDRQAPSGSSETGPLPRIEPGIVSDFSDGSLQARIGFGWAPSTDTMMGGASTVDLTVVNEKLDRGGKYLQVRGAISTGAAFPWAGAIFFPGAQPMAPADGSHLSALSFEARGQGVLRLMVFSESLGWIPAQYEVPLEPSWTRFAVPFEAFEGVDRGAIKGVLFSGGPALGPFEFALDEVGFDED